MSQVTEQSVRFQTALASIKLIQASAVLDLTEDDFDFLMSNKVWIVTDGSHANYSVDVYDNYPMTTIGYGLYTTTELLYCSGLVYRRLHRILQSVMHTVHTSYI